MKKTKKYALNNSYFKVNNMLGLPETIVEIAEYLSEHGELPFAYNGNNWIYDAFVEQQKYRGVQNSQFLTPDDTADRMLHFAGKYFTQNAVLEPCCGIGQITKEIIKDKYALVAFDNDKEMYEICKMQFPSAIIKRCDFREFNYANLSKQIIANPPYEITVLTEFLEWIDEMQDCGGISILLLPKGFIDKDKPRRTFEALRKFGVLEKEDMQEDFARTKTRAEIVVLRKL